MDKQTHLCHEKKTIFLLLYPLIIHFNFSPCFFVSVLFTALWVMWGLLCGHLVAFKAPKSWPNKFLINVWGGFSVIFVASYTANIAALIAGLFFHHATSSYDASVIYFVFVTNIEHQKCSMQFFSGCLQYKSN